MDTNEREVIFEPDFLDAVYERPVKHDSIMSEFLYSNYFLDNYLDMNRFLDQDKIIDLEKLELAIILLIDHLENSVKIEDAIYINLGNMKKYFEVRNVTDIDKVIEESSFILGFCSSIADEYKIDRDVVVIFKGSSE